MRYKRFVSFILHWVGKCIRNDDDTDLTTNCCISVFRCGICSCFKQIYPFILGQYAPVVIAADVRIVGCNTPVSLQGFGFTEAVIADIFTIADTVFGDAACQNSTRVGYPAKEVHCTSAGKRTVAIDDDVAGSISYILILMRGKCPAPIGAVVSGLQITM